jgi:HEAT repeat protein
MVAKVAGRGPVLRIVLLVIVLAGLLAYSYLPIPAPQAADSIEQQLNLLRTGGAQDRSDAATKLASTVNKDAARIVPLLTAALKDGDAQVRYSAVGALHALDPKDPQAGPAIEALLPALRDADARVRALAAGILSTLKPDPKQALPELIAAARPVGGALPPASAPSGPSTGPIRARESIDRNQSDHARASAVAAIGVIGANEPLARKTLLDLARDDVPEVRMVVARVLGETGQNDPEALDALLKLAADTDLYIQARAITALGSFPKNYVASCPVLYRAYLSKQRPLQEGADLSLQKITRSTAFDATAARASKDASLRFAAVFSLDADSEGGLQSLGDALKDDDAGVRLMAATRLGKVNSKRAHAALAALKRLSDDKDEDVRDQMHRSVSMITARDRNKVGD